jgi:CheY-like chemotaxis protein
MSLRILAVHQQHEILELIKDVARALGWCDVLASSDSREALTLFDSQKFDGLIVAAEMPHLDGLQVAEHVRDSALNPGIPVVVLAESDDTETMRKGFEAGATFFMATPSSHQRVYRLLTALHSIMAGQRRRYVRMPYRTKVECYCGQHRERHFVAESHEIGEGGMSLSPSGGIDVGQEVELRFILPPAFGVSPTLAYKGRKSLFAESELVVREPRWIRAKMRYRTAADMAGLEFVSLPPACRQAIKRFVTGGVNE